MLNWIRRFFKSARPAAIEPDAVKNASAMIARHDKPERQRVCYLPRRTKVPNTKPRAPDSVASTTHRDKDAESIQIRVPRYPAIWRLQWRNLY